MSPNESLPELQPRPWTMFPQRQRIAAELQRLRLAAGLSTYDMAAILGVSQSKVSKIENGRVAVSPADAEAWARAAGAPADAASKLSRRALDALTSAATGRTTIRSLTVDLAERQREVMALERASTAVRSFTNATLPGLVQTADFARRIFARELGEGPHVARAVAARLERQTLLYEEGRELEMLLSEASLHAIPGPPAAVLAQLDRLREIMTLPGVRLGIIPLEAFATAWMWHDFTLVEGMEDDADLVHVETLTAVLNISHPEDVEAYRRALARLRAVAVRGEEASGWIARRMAAVAQRPSTQTGAETET